MDKKFITYILGIGGLLAGLLIVMQVIQYQFLVKNMTLEMYLLIIGFIFLGMGIWVGQILVRRRPTNSTLDHTLSDKNQEIALSDREKEILLLISDGLSNNEIAEKLFISIHTVKSHTSTLYQKLEVKRRTQAVKQAKKLGIIKDNSPHTKV